MRSIVLSVLLVLSIVLAGCSQETATVQAQDARMVQPQRVLRHVVLFKFKDTATPEQIQTVVDAFRSLPNKIDVVKGFEWGTDISPEKRSEGFTHCFFLTFHSEADRDTYLHHPVHQEFASKLGPYLDKPLVVDYWAQK